MATLTIDSLDDGVYARLQSRARENNRSVEAEARELLAVLVEGENEIEQEKQMRATVADVIAFGDRMKEKYGVRETDSVAMIRAIRDEE